MRRIFRNLSSLLLAVVLLLSLSVTAFAADGTVTYQGHKKITITPATAVYTETDLFGAFKGIMPGDRLTEEVKITNWAIDCDYVKVYMQAIPHHEAANPLSEAVDRDESVSTMEDFLAQLHMTVKKGTKTLYSASPDETAQLTDRVYLGSLRRLKSMTLDVELLVPATLGNEFAYREGEVDWVFTFEAGNDTTPKTGDTIMTAVLVMVIAAAGLVLLLILGKKKKNRNA